VKLFRKPGSRFLWYDFTARGERFRASTQETNLARAGKVASLRLADVLRGTDPLDRKPPTLREYSKLFLEWVDRGRLESDTRRYYRNGWRLLEVHTRFIAKRMDKVSADEIENLRFPGSPSNANNALRTLRRMLHRARNKNLIGKVPKFALYKEWGRSLRLNSAAERALLLVAEQPLADMIVVMRDTGQRNARELYRMRVEHLDFDERSIAIPDSKTASGKRRIPMSERVAEILTARCHGRNQGWVWESRRKGKHIGEALVNRQWVRARQAAGLPPDLVLYCARHDYGSFVLSETGNLKAVMNAMGHADVKSAMIYQHPEGEIIRTALNARHIPRHTTENGDRASA
jgi:integrase